MIHDDAVERLYQHLGALPDDEIGTINLLPWSQESEGTNKVKRKVCEAIVRVLEPFLASESPSVTPPSNVLLQCGSCGTALLDMPVYDGVANTPGAYTISQLARLNVMCPHEPITLDDQRRKIEEALDEMRAEE